MTKPIKSIHKQIDKQLECCDSCRFSKDPWKRAPLGDDTIWCRRYPPTNEVGVKRYPIVKRTDWCGEYKTAPLPDKSR